MAVRKIGIQVKTPKGKCNDKDCPVHGSLKCRGRIFVGTVISAKMQKTVTIRWERKHYLKKFERFEKRKSTIKAHNPSCINAHEGNVIKIMECRPLSKTKNFVIVDILGKEKGFKEKMEAKEEARFKESKLGKAQDVQKSDIEENTKIEGGEILDASNKI